MKRLLALSAVLASVALSGCGFTPLYGDSGVVSKLAAIQVVTPKGRTGFLLGQHLNDAFDRNRGAPPEYRMEVSLSEARYPRGIRTDNVATRYEYVITADYVLASLPSGAVAKKGRVRVETTYDSADQPYASIAAQQDAEDRGAEEAARRIQLELAAWLATGYPKSGAAKIMPKLAPPLADVQTPAGTPPGVSTPN